MALAHLTGLALAASAIFAGLCLLGLLVRPKPQPKPEGPAGFMHLIPGRTYKVVRPFSDYDGIAHPEGETFLFKGYNFLPYEDGLTLIGEPSSLRLQWRPEAQGEIINSLADYIAEA